MPSRGLVLPGVLVDELGDAAVPHSDILLGMLDDAATFGEEHDRPWFAFLALPDSAFEPTHPSA
jgi:hypothetical protein